MTFPLLDCSVFGNFVITLIDVIITLGKRNIEFRGNWNKETSEEDGNFMLFVNWKSSFDLVLKEHIEKKISYGKYLVTIGPE